ncbi:hypothetical protein [Chamaesiphon sp.]|uniref:hypothetical protein n=1 Tax=Chamaesiphon sp. TaxID=2814140 RepID=UPI0035939CA6
MMQGYVNENYEAIISVAVKNGNSLRSVDAVSDTGFTGFLSLPIAIIIELELQWSYRDRATLGDANESAFCFMENNDKFRSDATLGSLQFHYLPRKSQSDNLQLEFDRQFHHL